MRPCCNFLRSGTIGQCRREVMQCAAISLPAYCDTISCYNKTTLACWPCHDIPDIQRIALVKWNRSFSLCRKFHSFLPGDLQDKILPLKHHQRQALRSPLHQRQNNYAMTNKNQYLEEKPVNTIACSTLDQKFLKLQKESQMTWSLHKSTCYIESGKWHVSNGFQELVAN